MTERGWPATRSAADDDRSATEKVRALALFGVLVASGSLDELGRRAADGAFRVLARHEIDAVFAAAGSLCGSAAAEAARRVVGEATGGSEGLH